MSTEAQGFKAQGISAFKEKDYTKAVEFFSQAINADSNDHSFFF